jgi:hypothetical protein
VPFAYKGGKKADYYTASFGTKGWAVGAYTLSIDLKDGSAPRVVGFTLRK